MIEWLMFGALGFLLGCLLALMLAPPLWNRAVKLTTRKLEATMPMSLADIQADKDQLRAEFAIDLRKVEVALVKAKDKAARELIEANKRRVEIQVLQAELAAVKGQVKENENANRVLQQTIKRRLPDLDSRLKSAKKALAELEGVNTELRNTVASQSEALKTARATLHNQRADIDRLRNALESGGAPSMRGLSKSDARHLNESQRLSAELSRTQEELDRARTGAQENALLRREMSRLASQILNVTRAQGAQPHMVVEVTQAFADFSESPEGQGSEDTWQGAHAGNGDGREPEMAETAMEMETAAAEMPEAVDPGFEGHGEPAEHPAAPEDVEESAGPKGPLARRFAARRERRRARKAGGGSLSDRLRRIVVDAPESHS